MEYRRNILITGGAGFIGRKEGTPNCSLTRKFTIFSIGTTTRYEK